MLATDVPFSQDLYAFVEIRGRATKVLLCPTKPIYSSTAACLQIEFDTERSRMLPYILVQQQDKAIADRTWHAGLGWVVDVATSISRSLIATAPAILVSFLPAIQKVGSVNCAISFCVHLYSTCSTWST